MITGVEALNFRCLRYISRPLDRFHVLVGPNASGKTTFLDVVAFLGDLVSDGLESAVDKRTKNFQDLLWGRGGDLGGVQGPPEGPSASGPARQRFELAINAAIPPELREKLPGDRDTVRYEVEIGLDASTHEVSIFAERVLLRTTPNAVKEQRRLFPSEIDRPESILSRARAGQGVRTVANKVSGGNDNFYSEVYGAAGKGWAPAFRLGPRKSALGNLPEDESKFPVSTWLKGLLSDGVERMVLNSLLIRKASPPGQPRGFRPDGSNLPWVIHRLENESPDHFRQWVSHVRTALGDLETVRTVVREDDRHRYLMLRYTNGLEVPSWVASDGTLRLLALTLPAYLADFRGIYLIEEPENGLHPGAVETAFQSLSSAYDAQILMATHSPVILSLADAASVLCFAKTPSGSTDVVSGSEHPALADWRGEVNLSDLFAAGVLG